MNDETLEDIFVKSPELLYLLKQKSEHVEVLAEKQMRKEYKKCVMPKYVDLDCLKRVKNFSSVFLQCSATSLFRLSTVYRECVEVCIEQDSPREYCFMNCKEIIMESLDKADYNQLVKSCAERNFID